MADVALGLIRLIEFGAPIGIAVCEDPEEKASVYRRAKSLAEPAWRVRLVHCEQEALELMRETHFIVLDPSDEVAAIHALDRARDHVLAEGSRLLLLLLRDGPGLRALMDAPALASFARADLFSVGVAVRLDVAKARFLAAHGVPYDEWLRQWRMSELADTSENNLLLAEAIAIEVGT